MNRSNEPSILGFERKSGQHGIRNRVMVVFTVECASHVAKSISAKFPDKDVQYFGFSGCYPSDYGYRLVRGMCVHPNVGAVLLVSLGCENFDALRLKEEISASGRYCDLLVIQKERGTVASIHQGVDIVRKFHALLLETPRVKLGLSDLTVGTICGGSDGTSVITGNPAVGRAFDVLIDNRATCIFEESGELIGVEDLMMKRAVNNQVRLEIKNEMIKCRKYYETLGLGSFSNGNAVGGLTTQEEKSLGAYAKSGSSLICGVIYPTVRPNRPGLYLMDVIPDGPVRFGFPNICDTAEACELIATGCHMILFTTGRGSTIGSVVSPVIKICNNPETWENLSGDMDINAGKIISAGAGLDDIRDEILSMIKNVASGFKTKSEALGHSEFSLTYKAYDFSGRSSCKP